MNPYRPKPASTLEALLAAGEFVVTAEVVPPKSANPAEVLRQARTLVGYADAVNVTDNPTASAHMSAVAGAALVAGSGIEPTLQLQLRDRNRLAVTSDLLGGWALGARNLLCLTGDPVGVGDHPDAVAVHDLDVQTAIRLSAMLREEGRLLTGREIDEPPAYFIGAADAPLAPDYDPGKLEAKLDAGARFVQTQITYDVDAMGAWAERLRERGVTERAFLLAGVAPLRSAKQATYVHEHVPGIVVPGNLRRELEDAGGESAAAGVQQCVEIVKKLRAIPGIDGVHVMGMGHEDGVLDVIEAAGLLPRPTAPA